METLPIKYKQETIIPDDIIKGDRKPSTKYILSTGEIVTIDWVSGFNNKYGEFTEILENKCQYCFGMPFSRVRSIWTSRIGQIPTIWHYIKLNKHEEKRATLSRVKKQNRR